MTSVLQKKISKIWLIPLAFVGLPFLLATAGRLLGAFGAEAVGEALVEWARVYGNLPIALLGFAPAVIENPLLAYVLSGILYAAIVFLCVAILRPSLWRAGR